MMTYDSVAKQADSTPAWAKTVSAPATPPVPTETAPAKADPAAVKAESKPTESDLPTMLTEAPAPTETAPVGQIIVTVPKAFKLNIDGAVRDIKAGVQRMPIHYADHWYSKANGVVIFDHEA